MQKPSPNTNQDSLSDSAEFPLPENLAQKDNQKDTELQQQLDAIPRFKNEISAEAEPISLADEHQIVANTPVSPSEPSAPTTIKPEENTKQELARENERQKAKEKLQKLRKHPHFRTVRFAVVSFLLFVLIFNFPLIYSQIVYYASSRSTNNSTNTPNSNQTTTPTPAPDQAEVVGSENRIIIPKINVNAPIVFVPTLDEAEILRGLQDGVVHYAGTANPGENGNAVFFGHSSNDWWQAGNYKFVFVLLERLSVGDTYEIHYQSRKYVYTVTETKVVNPTDLSVLTQTSTPFSTIITCTPPGTSWRRFVVKAQQTSPAPASAQKPVEVPSTPQVQPSELPSASPNILDQILQFFSQTFSRFFGGNTSVDSTNGSSTTTPVNRLPETF